jgi:hypothetical protein
VGGGGERAHAEGVRMVLVLGVPSPRDTAASLTSFASSPSKRERDLLIPCLRSDLWASESATVTAMSSSNVAMSASCSLCK